VTEVEYVVCVELDNEVEIADELAIEVEVLVELVI
jgi:hypothetical protein